MKLRRARANGHRTAADGINDTPLPLPPLAVVHSRSPNIFPKGRREIWVASKVPRPITENRLRLKCVPLREEAGLGPPSHIFAPITTTPHQILRPVFLVVRIQQIHDHGD